jgi:hypothetical protein
VPTIYHRTRFEMVGTLSLCPPYNPLLIARPRSSLVLREHDSSGVLTLKSVGSEPWSKLFS